MIWLARHGETTWNMAGRYQGRLESALSGLGVRQGLALADAFVERLERREPVPARIVSSPLLRCAATARFSGERLGLPLELDARLIEIAHGTWDGRYRDDLAREDPERYRAWRSAPASVAFDGGETLADVLARWRDFAHDLAREPRHTLVVTHDAVVRCALVDLMGRSLDDFWAVRVENAAYALLESDGARLRVRDECVTAHLADARANVTAQAL
ncbi:MAG: histidine phosphatase family protein [Candidatus Eremiobacteraeota bacterium]|nr:histidine phosphatase family protein [Candidatus Eremiobacteraeota bacterium]